MGGRPCCLQVLSNIPCDVHVRGSRNHEFSNAKSTFKVCIKVCRAHLFPSFTMKWHWFLALSESCFGGKREQKNHMIIQSDNPILYNNIILYNPYSCVCCFGGPSSPSNTTCIVLELGPPLSNYVLEIRKISTVIIRRI